LVQKSKAGDGPGRSNTKAAFLIAVVVVIAGGIGAVWFWSRSSQERAQKDTNPAKRASVSVPSVTTSPAKKKPASAPPMATPPAIIKPDLSPVPDSAPPVDLQQPDTTAPDIRSPDTSSTITQKSDISIAALLDPETPDENIRIIANGLIARGTNKELVAKKLNTRGMKFYKVKAYNRAVFAFELSHSTDPSYELAIYNRACVAGIMGDAKLAADWLGRLKRVGTPKARKALRKAQTDHDFDSIRRTPVFKKVIQ